MSPFKPAARIAPDHEKVNAKLSLHLRVCAELGNAALEAADGDLPLPGEINQGVAAGGQVIVRHVASGMSMGKG